MISELEALKKENQFLKSKILEMFDAENAYYKSSKDYHLLKTWKAKAAALKEYISPKQKLQQTIFTQEFLGQ